MSALKGQFRKLTKLEFLQNDGSIAFALDNNIKNKRSNAFIQEGELSVNLQNGQRRTATVTLDNTDDEYCYDVNKLWFGQQIRLSEGMLLPSGEEFYIPQGVFYILNPTEVYAPTGKTVTLNLADKWSYLDGTLFGNLEGIYEVPVNSDVFDAIATILRFDRRTMDNGTDPLYFIDRTPPIFTEYYNGKTQKIESGDTALLTKTPYTIRHDSIGDSFADVILELNSILAGWIGYDATGALRLDPSQDDILDIQKPVLWEFTPREATLLGASYTVNNSEVYNDLIIRGESLTEYGQVAARAENLDPSSPTNINLIGRKTLQESTPHYYSEDICEAYAVFWLKRRTILQQSVSISCNQMFHITENNLVTLRREDKVGAPIERHLISGFTRPLGQEGPMTINVTSVQDFPIATVTKLPGE